MNKEKNNTFKGHSISVLQADREYLGKLIRVARGGRTSSDFSALTGILQKRLHDLENNIYTGKIDIDLLKNLSDVAYNRVTFEELCDACIGLRWQGRCVDIDCTPDIIREKITKEICNLIKPRISMKKITNPDNRSSAEGTFIINGIKKWIEKNNCDLSVSYIYTKVLISPRNYGVHKGFSLKSIKELACGDEKLYHYYLNLCGYHTEESSIKGNLTPCNHTELIKMLEDKAFSLGMTFSNFAFVQGVTDNEARTLYSGVYGLKPDVEVISKFAKAFDEFDEGKLFLLAGYVYHENMSWNVPEFDTDRLAGKCTDVVKFTKLLSKAIGDRTLVQFAKDANICYYTIKNLLAGKYSPRKRVLSKIAAASADPTVTYATFEKVVILGGVEKFANQNVFTPVSEEIRNEHTVFFDKILIEQKLTLKEYAIKLSNKYGCDMYRRVNDLFLGSGCYLPSDRTMRRVAENSQYTFEEIHDMCSRYYGDRLKK